MKLRKARETFGLSEDGEDATDDSDDIISGATHLAPIPDKTAWMIGKIFFSTPHLFYKGKSELPLNDSLKEIKMIILQFIQLQLILQFLQGRGLHRALVHHFA